MFKFVLIASLLVSAALAAPIDSEEDAEALRQKEQEQNENAQYNFNSSIDDHINDGFFKREETREGSKVTGSYSYSDGYVMRTVHYIADKDGYRVVKDEMQDIGDGPIFNENGQADVESSMIGKYSIMLDKTEEDKHYKGILPN